MNQFQNQNTQPIKQMKIFNNWNIVTKGWYIACPIHDIPKNKAKSLTICGQRIVIFRGKDNQIRALDAYCPHLGTDLGIGRVDGNLIRCFFHHWAYDGSGKCQDIPCQNIIPEKAKIQSYATEEKYGFIWIYPDSKAPEPVAEFDELKDKDITFVYDKPFTRNCHHHICMMNGIDAQHLQTVHKLNIKMDLTWEQNPSGTIIDFTLSGEFPKTTAREKIARKILGNNYEYTMRYAHGCIGFLTIMKKVKIIPPLHMIYAYTPLENYQTLIQPIYIAEKRKGILSYFITRILLLLTKLAYYFLRGEDGMIYDNIRYNPNVLLSIDEPLIKYMNYVNNLQPSIWSKGRKRV
ncbi:MAG: aromatic ring-hydroxylating dioxygenase subunit alpha [Nostocaceae cyanobacterium]|nr:aromatic ring-hydroxylating dioxygenase subunit alpha [Nostocaceae cyanobacterium]